MKKFLKKLVDCLLCKVFAFYLLVALVVTAIVLSPFLIIEFARGGR